MLPLSYLITLTRNEQGRWLAVFGDDIIGRPADDLQTALANLGKLLEMHRELADLLLSPEIYARLTENIPSSPPSVCGVAMTGKK
jgi:hypothetical protein